jgi:hypothetical protein
VLAHDALGGFNAFHQRHGNVHQHHVRANAFVLGDGGAAVARFAGDLPAKLLHHARQVFARKHRVVHQKVANTLSVFSLYRRERLHSVSP